MNSPKVSIIISNYQGIEFLPRCLEHLMNQTYPNYEVVLIDAGSTDGSPEYIERHFPQVKLIRSGRIGIGEAVNIGIKHSMGEIICFDYNTDEFAEPECIEELVSYLNKYNYKIITGITRIIYGTDLIDEAGVNLDWFLRPKKNWHGKKREEYVFKNAPVDFVGSPTFHRDILKVVGIVDEDYFIYAEDLDFCFRAKQLGIETRHAPLAISRHCIRGTTGKNLRLREYYLRRANIRFQIKLCSLNKLFGGVMYLCIILPFFTFIATIVSNKKHSIYYEKLVGRLDAVLWNLKNLKKTIADRKCQQAVIFQQK